MFSPDFYHLIPVIDKKPIWIKDGVAWKDKEGRVPWGEWPRLTMSEAQEWISKGSTHKVAMIMGDYMGIVCIDIDDMENPDNQKLLMMLHEETGPTLSVPSSKPHKAHFFYEYPPLWEGGEIGSCPFPAPLHGDFKGNGFVVLHQATLDDTDPYVTAQIRELPPEMVERLDSWRKPTKRAVNGKGTWGGGEIIERERNDTLFRYGCELLAKKKKPSEIMIELLAVNTDRVKPPLNSDEIGSIHRSVMTYDKPKTKEKQHDANKWN